MGFMDYCEEVSDFVQEHSSLLLLIGGITTGLAAGCLAVYEAKEANDILEDVRKSDEYIESSKPIQIVKEVVAVTPTYSPAILLAATAMVELIFSYKVNMDHICALGSALTMASQKCHEYDIYREKAIEKFGKSKDEQVKQEVDKELIRESGPVPNNLTEETLVDGNMLMWDRTSGRFFRSTPEKIRKAEATLVHRSFFDDISLNEMYEELGAKSTDLGDNVGWPMGTEFYITFDSYLMDDGVTTCTAVRFNPYPFKDKYVF